MPTVTHLSIVVSLHGYYIYLVEQAWGTYTNQDVCHSIVCTRCFNCSSVHKTWQLTYMGMCWI